MPSKRSTLRSMSARVSRAMTESPMKTGRNRMRESVAKVNKASPSRDATRPRVPAPPTVIPPKTPYRVSTWSVPADARITVLTVST